ncbi:deoxyribonuclease IV [Chitinivibrio alkaliphilus]|uniref:Probable endonuclease 4 n=1 Tax=Chitinivibrio alkaliphilus ACht1 TaxID=1313304 RepID=U7D7D3_9BACT|nr:deoxyribonuclease IV [Chitinivibrio alkaliphilus]ERP38860.1 endonuclease IV [Chitinivibrio alkaliphilus ACht1]
MKYIGPHVSITGGVQNAPERASELGATGFGMFTKNQRQWHAKPLTPDTISSFWENMHAAEYTSDMVLPHGTYLVNLCNPEREKRIKSLSCCIDELQRCSLLSLATLNIHPGSHLNKNSESQALALIAESINSALAETEDVTLVLENTSGQGTNLGYRLEHLAEIISQVNKKNRMGVCIDTCHAFSAGYDLSTKEGAAQFFEELDARIGLSYLRGLHLNDSKTPFGSRKDRHEILGAGELGMAVFEYIAQNDTFTKIPLVLETPRPELWKQEISHLQELAGGLCLPPQP